MLYFIKLLFLTILIFMAIQTWGSLQKSTTDDETIEQAIGRLISDHESDESAHLGVGESLQSHKSEEVIDHPPGSVISDKQTFRDYEWRMSFEAIGAYGDSQNLDLPEAGTMRLATEYNVSDYGALTLSFLMPQYVYNENKDMTISFGARFDNTITGVSGNLRFGYFSFHITSGVLKARYPYNSATGEINLSAIDIQVDHFYKIIYTASSRTADFYIDSNLVGSITKTSGSYVTSNQGPAFDITEPSSGYCYLYITNLFFSRQS